MNRRETIGRLCRLQEEVSVHLDDHDNAADCFCREGGHWGDANYSDFAYRNDGVSLEFIEAAVVEKMHGEKKCDDLHLLREAIDRVLGESDGT